MPKAKKPLTPEQKQALVDRLAAARAKKAALKAAEATQAAIVEATTAPEESMRVETAQPAPIDYTETVVGSGESTEVILKRALEAIETLAKLQAMNATAPQTGLGINNGRLTGTVTKFSVDPNDYPSPVERLKNEARLAPFAFPLNYDLDYSVTTTAYESKDNINYVEPKFTLELQRIIRDDMTGEPTGGRYVLCKMVMHEDPQAAMTVARANGIDIESMDEKAFLDEMRYLQMRDWLFESFFQPINTNRDKRSEMVVGGKIVEFFEINDQNSKALPFNELNRYKA